MHSIQPIQQFANTKGKNATDSAMIIDAMDLLYTGNFGGYSGWAPLGTVGNRIAKQAPDFDPRNYGYGKLSTLVSATKLFKSEVREQGSANHKVVYIRELKKK